MAKDIVQIKNPKSNKYIKIDRTQGKIIAHKQSYGPYKGVNDMSILKTEKVQPTLGNSYNTSYVILFLTNDNQHKSYQKLKKEFETNNIVKLLVSRNGQEENAFLIPLDVSDIVTFMTFAWDNHQSELLVLSETYPSFGYKRSIKSLDVFTEKYMDLGTLYCVSKMKPQLNPNWIKDLSTGNYFCFN